MATTKAILCAAAGFMYWISLTPPNNAKGSDKVVKEGLFGFLVQRLNLPLISKTAVAIWYLCQALVDLGTAGPTLCPRNVDPILSPGFMLGAFLVISMALLRLVCFATMGELFTFVITQRSNHKLVRTGPYSMVRHPAYTGQIAIIFGVIITIFARGSWIRECGLLGRVHRFDTWMVYTYLLLCLVTVPSLIRRAWIEDEHLEKIFGNEFKEYKRRVPWRFIPLLI